MCVLAQSAWEFISVNVPMVAVVEWTEKSSVANEMAVCLVFGAFNHEFPSQVALCIATVNVSPLSEHQLVFQSSCLWSPGGGGGLFFRICDTLASFFLAIVVFCPFSSALTGFSVARLLSITLPSTFPVLLFEVSNGWTVGVV